MNIKAVNLTMTGVNNFVILQDAGTMSEAVLQVEAPVLLAGKDVLNTEYTANHHNKGGCQK